MSSRSTVVFLLLLGAFGMGAAGEPSQPAEHVYRTVGDLQLKAFVFKPPDESDEARGAVLVFHGGGWSIGEASWGFGRARHYADLGLVGISVQYRLSDQKSVTPLDAMEDAREAFKWVRANADELGVDPRRVAGYGWSAGAHLITAAALFETAGEPSSRPDALLLVSPAVALEGDGWVRRLLLDKATARSISPDNHVREGMPPTLILQGETDTVTPTPGVRRFCDRMRAAGNSCELNVFNGVGHLFTPSSEPDDGWPNPDPEVSSAARAKGDAFLRSRGFIPGG